MTKKPKIVLKYFAATQAGDWWPVKLGHTLERNGMSLWVVSGWNRADNIVYCACENRTVERDPADLHMRFMPEEDQ